MPLVLLSGSAATPLITEAMITPIIDSITTSIQAIVPAGIGVLGLIFSIKAVPKILHMFFG